MHAGARLFPLVGLLGLAVMWFGGCSKAPEPPSPPAHPQEQAVASMPYQRAVTNQQPSLAVRRSAVIKLAASKEGAYQLLQWALEGILPMDLRPVATLELAHVPWPELQTQAWEVLPPYRDKHQQLLPRLNTFLAFKGDPGRGPALFRHPDLNCIGCHRLNGEGVALGSDLSDVGLRMDAETLLENLLDPSAVISPGYETWLVVDKEENEWVGLLMGETEDALVLRDARNNEMRLSKDRVQSRRQVPVSLMPAGLQQGMTVQDLADLLLFLRSCRQSPATQVPSSAANSSLPR